MSTPNRASVASTTPSRRASQQPTPEDDGSQQFAVAVDDLLDQLQNKFDTVSTEIFGKLDEMSQRLDQLESSIIATKDSSNQSN